MLIFSNYAYEFFYRRLHDPVFASRLPSAFKVLQFAMDDTGLREACGIFGCVATGNWPTEVDVAHVICLGLTGLQHRWGCMCFTSEVNALRCLFLYGMDLFTQSNTTSTCSSNATI